MASECDVLRLPFELGPESYIRWPISTDSRDTPVGRRAPIGWPGDVPGRRRRRRGGARRRRSRSCVAARLRAGAALHGGRAVPADVGRGVPARSAASGRTTAAAGGARRGAGRRPGNSPRAGSPQPASGSRNRPLYLRFVQEQLARAEVAAWRRAVRPRLRGKARFAAVGVLAQADRRVRCGSRCSSAARSPAARRGGAPARRGGAARAGEPRPVAPSVPPTAGCSAPAATRCCSTGTSTPFNDWRSTFDGVNDHEADWEQVTVSSSPTPTAAAPGLGGLLVARPAGPDLRRRWDDPQLRRVGDHPVVYAGGRLALGRLPAGRLRRLRRAAVAARGSVAGAARAPAAGAAGRGSRGRASASRSSTTHRGDGPASAPAERTWRRS